MERPNPEVRSLKELFNKLVNGDPTDYSALYRGFSSDNITHEINELHNKRFDFYKELRNYLQPNDRVYYPGCGADPIPVEIFGDRVVYGSLMESPYFSFLKDPNSPSPARYEERIRTYGPFNHLKAVWADFLSSPFRDSSFGAIIVHGIGSKVFADKSFSIEAARLLRASGILVIDDENAGVNESGDYSGFDYTGFQHLEAVGFREHELDHFDGLSWVAFLQCNELLSYSNGYPCGSGLYIEKESYISRLKNKEHVVLMGHDLRVFQKK